MQLGTTGTGAGTTGAEITVGLAATTGIKARPASTGVIGNADSGLGSELEGNDQFVFAALPILSRVALSSTGLTNGSKDLAKFTVGDDGGTIGWKTALFSVTGKLAGKTVGGDDTVADTDGIYTIDTGAGVADIQAIAATSLSLVDQDGNSVAGTFTVANAATGTTVTFVATDEQQVSSTKTYTLRGTVLGSIALASGDNMVVNFSAGDTQHRSSVAFASVNAASNFIWTDRSATSHSASSTDWTNNWLVKNLPLDSWTLTY